MNRHVDKAVSGGEKTGDIIKYFSELDDILEKNSGVNDNKTLTSDASDPPCPVDNNTYTKVKITDDAIHITNIDKSSLTAQVEITVNVPTDFFSDVLAKEEAFGEFDAGGKTGQDLADAVAEENKTRESIAVARAYRNRFTKWFIGLKAGIHIFDAYRIYSYNKKTNCEQTEALYENAVVRMLKPQEELDAKPGIYTLWRHANAGDDCICGTYFSLEDLIKAKNNRGLKICFEVTVPLDDFLPLSGFSMYPNCVFENLSLELKMCIQQNFVVCQVDPRLEFERISKMDIKNVGKALAACYNHLVNDVPSYSRHFTQVNDPFKSTIYTVDKNGVFSANVVDTKFTITNGTFKHLRSHLNGFNIKDSVINQLREKYTEKPLIIPAQYCDYQAFSQKPMGSGLKCNTTYGMTNVSSLIFLFPRTHNEITCCQNPHLSSIQLQIDNKPYPDKPFSTLESAHTMFNLTNAGLDGLFSPSEEYAYSLDFRELDMVKKDILYTKVGADGNQEPTQSKVVDEEDTPVVAPYKDNTSYCLVCSTERLSGYGTFCDGLTKDNAHITLTGTIEGHPKHNPYLTHPFHQPVDIHDRNTSVPMNDRSPVMVICQDCFWVFRTDTTAEFVNNSKYFYDEMTGDDGEEEEITYNNRRNSNRRRRGNY